jgi:hypothetical protein
VTSGQPTPTVTDADVERIVRREFEEADVAAVLGILAEYGTEAHEPESARVRLAALKEARGDLDRLRQQVSSAKMDYRDVLSEAEYPLASRKWGRMKGMTDTERQAIYDADWHQYQKWLTRP